MQWLPVLPDGSIREALTNELLMYDLAWENLALFGGYLEIVDETSNSVTVMNNGWGAAYNVTAGNEIIEIIHPGEIVVINRNGNFMQYHRLLQIGEEEDLTLMNVNLTDIKSDNNESTPSLSFVSIIFCLMAVITFRRKK
jgi:hypothetical protein